MHKKFKKVQIDALFEAICESGLTPYFVVIAEHPDAVVPMDYVRDGIIILDFSGAAAKNFTCDDDGFMYSASFGGKPQTVIVPYEAIGSVYPKEQQGDGFQFPVVIPKARGIKAPLKVADETSFGGQNPDAHVGWEKSATIV